MLRITTLSLFLVPILVHSAVAADIDKLIAKLKSPAAREAAKSYEDAVSTSQEGFTKRVTTAKKKLLADLEKAQIEATKANDLDEAILIREIKRSFKASSEPAPLMTDIHIISALYGQNISWLDVTDKVRQAIKGKTRWSTTVDTKDWGEPAPGFGQPRTLLIRYSVDGKVKFKATYQGRVVTIP